MLEFVSHTDECDTKQHSRERNERTGLYHWTCYLASKLNDTLLNHLHSYKCRQDSKSHQQAYLPLSQRFKYSTWFFLSELKLSWHLLHIQHTSNKQPQPDSQSKDKCNTWCWEDMTSTPSSHESRRLMQPWCTVAVGSFKEGQIGTQAI